MNLLNVRSDIDRIDDEMLALLEKRASLIERVARSKREAGVLLHDPVREREILERLCHKGAGHFPPEAIRSVYREVMSACMSLQDIVRVAFLGPEGTFTHMAARHLFGLASQYREAATISGVFDAVVRDDVMYGVVPAENSTEGSVNVTTDLLLEGGIQIYDEIVIPVSHCLLSRARGLTDIERIYSHPQALAQCRIWITKNVPSAQIIQTTSTAAAAREAASDPHAGALASELAGELHNVPTLRAHVEDRRENSTRFFVLSKREAVRTGADKTTIAFALADGTGSLRRALAPFEQHGVNLSRIESRPNPVKAWSYIFICDVLGHRLDAEVCAALEDLRGALPYVRTLGSYPRAEAKVEEATS